MCASIDDLCQAVELGRQYSVIGVPVSTTHTVSGRDIVSTVLEVSLTQLHIFFFFFQSKNYCHTKHMYIRMYLQSMPLYQLVKLAFVLRLLTQASNITHHISSLPPPLSSSPAIFKLKQGIHVNTLLNTGIT